MFNRKVAEEGGTSAGLRFAEQALAVLFPILIVFTALMLAAAWPVTAALSGGFAKQQPSHADFAFAVMLSRFTIPYLMLIRSEEHTSELQSLMRTSYAVFCLNKQINTKQKAKQD